MPLTRHVETTCGGEEGSKLAYIYNIYIIAIYNVKKNDATKLLVAYSRGSSRNYAP